MTRLVFALLGLALVTMLVFEHWTTRVIGVLAIFGFVVAGAFAIADHEFLDPDVENGHPANADVGVAGNTRAEGG